MCIIITIPIAGDSVRSASAHNIKLISNDQNKIWKELIKDVEKVNLNGGTPSTGAGDAVFLSLVGKNVQEGQYKSLYIPIVSVKNNDCNWNNIVIS